MRIDAKTAAVSLLLGFVVLAALGCGSETRDRGDGAAAAATEVGINAKADAAATEPAITGLLAAFADRPIVAVSEAHQLRDEHEFFAALIRDPRFPAIVDDIVVEFGNARYQPIMDRYIAGEDVGYGDVRKAWLDTTQPLVWEAPVYEKFFHVVREVNSSLPKAEKLRVLLGDPPIDWRAVREPEDYGRYAERNRHYANVVLDEVLARGRRALLIAGGAHLIRLPEEVRAQFPDGGPNETAYIEQRYPDSMYLVEVHLGRIERNHEVERRLDTESVPSLTPTRGSWLERLRINGEPLRERWDAYLYLGPADSLVASHPDPSIYRDDAYFNELERRWDILRQFADIPGGPLRRHELMQPRPAGFLDWEAALARSTRE